jgi:hypothetical protein
MLGGVCAEGRRLALQGTMRFKHPDRSVQDEFPMKALAVVAVLVVVLLGGLSHHHTSAADADACSYCHVGLETPVIDLTGSRVATALASVGYVTPTRPYRLPRIVHFLTHIPRAPPVTTHPVMFREGCVGLV